MFMDLQLFSSNTVLARKWKFFIGTGEDKKFVQISGITSFTISKSKEDLDTTDFDNDGYDSHVVGGRGFSIKVSGHMRMDSTGQRCAGQARVEACGELMGVDSIVPLVILPPAGKGYLVHGSINIADVGGGNKDKTSWGFDLTGEGKMQRMTDAYKQSLTLTYSDVDSETDITIPDEIDV